MNLKVFLIVCVGIFALVGCDALPTGGTYYGDNYIVGENRGDGATGDTTFNINNDCDTCDDVMPCCYSTTSGTPIDCESGRILAPSEWSERGCIPPE